MAYTNAWDNTLPLGTAAANTIDDIFRSLKVDISERLLSVFAAIDADPLIIKTGVTTAGTFGVGTNLSVGGTLAVTGTSTQAAINASGNITQGIARLKPVANQLIPAGAATTIYSGGSDGEIDYLIITGTQIGSNIAFLDIVAFYNAGIGAVTPVVLSSSTLIGAPATRTYTYVNPGKTLQLQLSGATNYNIRVRSYNVDA